MIRAVIVLALLIGCGQKGETHVLDSGLTIIIQKEGDGDPADALDILDVCYTGKLEDGTIFDENNYSFKFTLGAGWVIDGWEEGLVGMKVGGKRRLIVSPDLGYGQQDSIEVIPPGSTLIFDIELIGLEKF